MDTLCPLPGEVDSSTSAGLQAPDTGMYIHSAIGARKPD